MKLARHAPIYPHFLKRWSILTPVTVDPWWHVALAGVLDTFPEECIAGNVVNDECITRVPLCKDHLPTAFEWLLQSGLERSGLHWSVAEGGLNAVFHSLFAAHEPQEDTWPTSLPLFARPYITMNLYNIRIIKNVIFILRFTSTTVVYMCSVDNTLGWLLLLEGGTRAPSDRDGQREFWGSMTGQLGCLQCIYAYIKHYISKIYETTLQKQMDETKKHASDWFSAHKSKRTKRASNNNKVAMTQYGQGGTRKISNFITERRRRSKSSPLTKMRTCHHGKNCIQNTYSE